MTQSETFKAWLPEIWRVVSVKQENQDTVTLSVEPKDNSSRQPAKPGQFYMVYAFGIGEVPISLSYIGDDTLHFTIRGVGAVTQSLNRLSSGDDIGLRGPFGSAWPLSEMQDHALVIIAGGLGLAPLKPVLDWVISQRLSLPAVHLLYGSRDPEHLLFQEQVRLWQNNGIEVQQTVDTADHSWFGHVGVVTELMERIPVDPKRSRAFICGPEVMMRYSANKLQDLGYLDSHIFLSMERNMKCAMGWCGHCQYGSHFVCKDGPVFRYDSVATSLRVKEL